MRFPCSRKSSGGGLRRPLAPNSTTRPRCGDSRSCWLAIRRPPPRPPCRPWPATWLNWSRPGRTMPTCGPTMPPCCRPWVEPTRQCGNGKRSVDCSPTRPRLALPWDCCGSDKGVARKPRHSIGSASGYRHFIPRRGIDWKSCFRQRFPEIGPSSSIREFARYPRNPPRSNSSRRFSRTSSASVTSSRR